MTICRVSLLLVTALLSLTGCVAPATGPVGPTGISNGVRDQIGRMAIRGPTPPSITLTTELDSKGQAAGRTAKDAGLGWLGGTLQAAGESGDPFAATLIASFGIITEPVVAAGGAIYGAAAADSTEAVETGNALIRQRREFAPAHLQHALESTFADTLPVTYVFVPDGTSGEALRARDFDSVLDVQMDAITSQPGEDRLGVAFEATQTISLTDLDSNQTLVSRRYYAQTSQKNVSTWAAADAQALQSELSASFTEMSAEIADEFFLAPAIRVEGLEPVSRSRFRIGRISGTMPLFVWSALDGDKGPASERIEYEIKVFLRGSEPEAGLRTTATRYVPPEPLLKCKRYHWQVRAHNQSFGQPETSDWSPTNRFKTPCK